MSPKAKQPPGPPRGSGSMSIENVMMAVAFVVILGTAGHYLRRAVRVLRRMKR